MRSTKQTFRATSNVTADHRRPQRDRQALYEELQDIAAAKNGRVLSKEYASYKMQFVCAKGHEWETTASSVKRGSWCKTCFQKDRAGKHALLSEYDLQTLAAKAFLELLTPYSEYKNVDTHMLWRCANGHQFMARPYNIRSGHGCPHCRSFIGEQVCREGFEFIFQGFLFPKSKPVWLINPVTRRQLELDGYCERLALAFEYQGEYAHSTKAVIKRDAIKRDLCEKFNVKLIEVSEFARHQAYSKAITEVMAAITKAGIAAALPRATFEPNVDTSRYLDATLRIIAEKGGTTTLRQHVSAHHVFKVTCKEGHTFNTNANRVLRDAWCNECWQTRRKNFPPRPNVQKYFRIIQDIAATKNATVLTDPASLRKCRDKIAIICVIQSGRHLYRAS